MLIESAPVGLFEHQRQQLQYAARLTSPAEDFGIDSRSDNTKTIHSGYRATVGTNLIFKENIRDQTNIRCAENSSLNKRSSSNHIYLIGRSGSPSCATNTSLPMGFDILARIRQLLSFGESTENASRKRRFESDLNANSQFKYRKVESDFPKIITRALDEVGDVNFMAQPVGRKSFRMSQDVPENRNRSILARKCITKPITNTAFADIEFSDDDDEIILTNGRGDCFNILRQKNIVGPTTTNPIIASSSTPKALNIPIKQRQPPPPLIEPRTGGILASTLLPDLQPIRTQKRTTYFGSYKNGLGSSRISNSISKDSNLYTHKVATPNLINGEFSVQEPFRRSQSIISQEHQRKDHEQYNELLQKVVPNLYGTKVPMAKMNLSTKNRLPGLRPVKQPVIEIEDDLPETKLKNINGTVTTIDLSDDDVSEILDLTDDELNVVSMCSKLQKEQAECSYDIKKKAEEKKHQLPYVEPVNTLKEKFDLSPICKADWLQKFQQKWAQKRLEHKKKLDETVKEVQERSADTRREEKQIFERFKTLEIVDHDLVVIDDFPEDDEEEDVVPLTQEQNTIVKRALFDGPMEQVVTSKFNMNITRKDIRTLLGNNWLNDEVINFYMNLLTERGERLQEYGLPKVYAMNTFFIPKLSQSGHSGVRRWTRKVDIFSFDIIPVPVHVGGVHWCMAIIHLRDRTIKYYDSMGTANPRVLNMLEQYLRDESLDKRKKPFDTSNFVLESVKDVPRQNNGCDCGVFSCMFAEYITRDKPITFSQQHMEHFRHKMVLEIVRGELLQ